MAKVRVEELGSIWGKEINEIRQQHIKSAELKRKLADQKKKVK